MKDTGAPLVNGWPEDFSIAITKFICGTVIHWQIQSKIRQALDSMKFALNHSYRFHNARPAFVVGLMQLTVMVFIEFINFLSLLTTTNLFEILRDFTALMIIADFDVLLYSSLRDEVLKDVLTDANF